MSKPDILVCYAITPDAQYRRMAAASAYSVAVTNPGVRIRIVEVPQPEGADRFRTMALVKPWAVPRGHRCSILFLDADTEVHASLEGLPIGDADFCARPETVWARGQVKEDLWLQLIDRAKVASVPLFNAGAFYCSDRLKPFVRVGWQRWANWILGSGLPDPVPYPPRPEWWMLDAIALALAVGQAVTLAGCTYALWGPADHSFQWQSERPGIIHHWSASRWKDPFAAKPRVAQVGVAQPPPAVIPQAGAPGPYCVRSLEDR